MSVYIAGWCFLAAGAALLFHHGWKHGLRVLVSRICFGEDVLIK